MEAFVMDMLKDTNKNATLIGIYCGCGGSMFLCRARILVLLIKINGFYWGNDYAWEDDSIDDQNVKSL